MTVRIVIGDALAELRKLPSDSVDMCCTSPPYWRLRDYGVAGQMGLEPTLGEHIAAMVELFEEVRRVLKPTGSLWLNYGDCYATAPNGRSAADTKALSSDDRTFRDKPFLTVGPIQSRSNNGEGQHFDRRGGILKPKDLCMIPNRLAIALQDAGWWVRSEIIWGKPNAMPDSSGVYRPSAAHEKIWLLTKSGDGDVWRARDTGAISFAPDLTERCALVTDPARSGPRWMRLGSYYDAEAVRVERSTIADGKAPDGWDTGEGGHGSYHRNGREPGKKIDKQRGHSRRHAGFNGRWDAMSKAEQQANGRLLRNYEPDLSAIVPPIVWEIATAAFSEAHFATFPPALVAPCVMAGCPVGGTVLDPFGGSGTTGLVADRLGRDAILIELNADYAAMAEQRLRANMAVVDAPPSKASNAGPLFDEAAA